MRRSTSTVRRACAVGTTAALVVLTTGLGIVTATAAHAETTGTTPSTQTGGSGTPTTGTDDDTSNGAGSGTTGGASGGSTTGGDTDGTGGTGGTGSDAGTGGTGSDAGTGGTGSDAGTDGTGSDTSAPGTGTGTPGTTTPDTTDPGSGTSAGTGTTGTGTGKGTTGTVPGSTDTTPAAPKAAAAAPTLTITGPAKVGGELKGVQTGLRTDRPLLWTWTETAAGTPTVLSHEQAWAVDAAQAGKTVTVSVTGELADGSTDTLTAESAVITQDPAFLGADGKPVTAESPGADIDDPLLLGTTAGDAFSYTFRAQGSPAPTYSLDWFFTDEEEESDSIVASRSQASSIAAAAGIEDETDVDTDFTPADQLPDGVTFDASTGEVSGTAEEAGDYFFAVTATSGTESVTQYADLEVTPAAAVGILAFTANADDVKPDSKELTTWVISPDGSVLTTKLTLDEDGFLGFDLVPGGRPTVKQGGTLLVGGEQVDRFGNVIDTTDDEGNETFLPTVTSDVASDVIAPYTADGVSGAIGVTFPHASTHTLTVAGGSLPSTSFAVEVQPVASTVAVVTPVGGRGELAYTGTDTTGALPWALGLVAAGAGIIGAGAYRRRRAQR